MAPIFDLLFPSSCIGCGSLNTSWCGQCRSTIQLLAQQSCYICRKPSTGGATCADHPMLPTTLNRLLVTCPYDANPLLKKAIHALKYQRRSRALAKPLGTLLARTVVVQPLNNTVLIPIPLHKTRLKERGFNQAELLAESLAQHLQHPISIRTDLLVRTRPTLSQAESKTREQRLQNLQNAFAATGPLDPTLTYLLLDDVCATCATLEDACRALREAGANEVWGMVLARN